MAEMLKGGVIMDVVTPEQAKIAEDAGAVAVMALERVPADIRAQGGVARMSDPDMIAGIMDAVSIPVMAKARIGHFVEAQVLQALGVDYIDESEVLTPADYENHIDKWAFTVPFVCGATNLGEALRRINEGAAMIRSKGEAGTGDVSNATTHMRRIRAEIRRLSSMSPDELYVAAKELAAPYELVRRGDDDAARRRGRLRRLGHLQVRGPGQAGGGDRQGHDLLRRPGRDRQGLPGPRGGDGRDQRRRHPRPAPPRRAWLVAAVRPSGERHSASAPAAFA
jgi:pyridoxal 5'-phosphate synthase subunit Pdx1